MSGKSIGVLVMLATIAGATGVSAQQRAPNPEAAAVRGVIESYASNMQAKNLAAIDSLFSAGRGVHIIEGTGVNHGWADYRDSHIGPELAEFTEFTYTFSSIEPVVRGDVAWAAFRYDLAATTSGGKVETEGRGTAVLEKQNGRWVISHLHTSGRRKAPGG